MFNRLVPILIFSILSLAAGAQTRLRNAEVTFADGHTEKGMISYKDWFITPDEIFFKKEGSTALRRLDTAAVKIFVVRDDQLNLRYEKHTVPVEITSLSSRNVFDKRTADVRERPVFLRCLLKGSYNLYSANFGFDDVFYVENRPGHLFPLINRRFEERGKIFTDSSYHQQIRDSLQLCRDGKAVSRLGYRLNELVSLLKTCGTHEEVFEEKQPALKNDYGIFAGAAFSQIHYKAGDGDLPRDLRLNGTVALQAGAFADINLNRSAKKYSLYIEAAYTQYAGKGTGKSWYDRNYAYDVRFGYAKLNSLFRYTFLRAPVFVQAGVTTGFLLSNRQVATYFDGSRERTRDIYPDLRGFTAGPTGGIGFTYKQAAVQLRYERMNGNSAVVSSGNSFQVFSAQINYAFLH